MATFEELAERLRRGLTAQERIDAAEELARLDDPRAAPALAKALADPSPLVRRHVEELLQQFSRRDDTGHLQALLDEAQRVAAALAAEVSRLRGDYAAEPPAVTEPIEPPPDYDGECVVVRLTAGPLDAKRACEPVADAIGEPLFTVTRQVHVTKGILARGVPARVARRLVHDLEKAGVLAGAAPADWLPEAPEPMRLASPQFGPGALRGAAVPSGQERAVPWDTVELVAAGRLEIELKRGRIDEDWSLLSRPLRPLTDDRRPHELAHEYLLEVYAGEPVERLQLLTYEYDFDVMQRKPAEFSSVARLARQLVRYVDRRRATAGVRRLEELDSNTWDDLTFLSDLAFEHYVAWQRLLLTLGVPLPR